jgi:hypothetical protein
MVPSVFLGETAVGCEDSALLSAESSVQEAHDDQAVWGFLEAPQAPTGSTGMLRFRGGSVVDSDQLRVAQLALLLPRFKRFFCPLP